jgi:adenine phosphoribosyltransferase
MMKISSEEVKKFIRNIRDFPKKGIIFRDITPLLLNGEYFSKVIDRLAEEIPTQDFEKIVAIEARGFILGGALSYKLKKGLAIVRKRGKLPSETISVSYSLEYGEETLELHTDAILPQEKVLIIDDVLATGGTVKAVIELVKKLGGEISSVVFLIELLALNGRAALRGYSVSSLIQY